MRKDNRTVDHLTRVVFHLIDYEEISNSIEVENLSAANIRQVGDKIQYRFERIAAMMDLLAKRGFAFSSEKNIIFAESETVEALEAKEYLIGNGFLDREFQVSLEYFRKWGMM